MKSLTCYFNVVVAVCFLITGCNPNNHDEPSSNNGRIELDGVVYPIVRTSHLNCGKLYSKTNSVMIRFHNQVESDSDGPRCWASFEVATDENVKYLSAGTYGSETSSSTLKKGTFCGDVSLDSFQGVMSGTLTVFVAGGNYTIEVTGTATCEDDVRQVKIVYTGRFDSYEDVYLGASDMVIDGVNYNVGMSVALRDYGAVHGDELYASLVSFLAPAAGYENRIRGDFYLFHETPSLTSGDYEYNRKNSMSVYGSLYNHGYYMSGGNIAVDVSGDIYTISFDNAEFAGPTPQPANISGGYSGKVNHYDYTNNIWKPLPTGGQ